MASHVLWNPTDHREGGSCYRLLRLSNLYHFTKLSFPIFLLLVFFWLFFLYCPKNLYRSHFHAPNTPYAARDWLLFFFRLRLFTYFSLNGLMHFPILCTMQYNCHWASTFSSPRSINRSIPLQYVISENTGSTICCRLEYSSRYAGSSIFSFIFSDKFSSCFLSTINNARARLDLFD